MVDELSTSAVQEIAGLSKQRGQRKLAKHLNLTVDDGELDMRQAIHLDFLYDNLMFAAEKGFSWDHVCLVAKFAENVLTNSLGKDLVAVLKYIQAESTEIGCELRERNFKVYIDFLFSTFLQHIKLFQFVFTSDRERMSPNVQLEIIPPKSSEPLKEAKEVKIWDYQQNYEGLQRKETEKQNERLLKKQYIAETAEKRLEESMKKIESKKEEKFTKETITDILKEVIGTYTTNTLDNMKWNIEDAKEDLEIKIQKTSLPRPQALGAPPRYSLKPKTPGSPPKTAKALKSASPERKKTGSGRSRKK
ncbi:uncharacterized protein C8orf74 homolog [Mytilus californianus]|uniref:uncharacterized protein C8orf74 homolog n=1 Tax=Mytilus californianus TaxID=6549 RepID=UPI00224609DA|nr:uncharacterized protein C8orf74 homolog [Mytilus californianus]